MIVYSVFDRRLDEAPAVVPDRFSWFAALLPPLYGLVHGLWLGLVLWVLAVAAIVAGGLWLGAEAGGWIYVLLAVLVGFEAPNFRQRKLRRRGYVYRTELIAAGEDLAQRDWLQRRAAP